jgi:YgiT-type zinc finger domain-containing protein
MSDSLVITNCPVCSSPEIRRVSGPWPGKVWGQAYVVEDLEYYACPNCGEKVLPPEAMRLIQAASPVFRGKPKSSIRKRRIQASPAV